MNTLAIHRLLAVITLAMPLSASALPGTWTDAGDLSLERYQHTATLLASGKVLVTGEVGNSSAVDIYDPAANSWSAGANIGTGRAAASASALSDGRVLVAGGNGPGNCVTTFPPSETVVVCTASASTEIYDPAANHWSAAGNLIAHRQAHTATVLASGKILVVGGAGDCTTVTTPTLQTTYCTYLASAELYDPATNTWSAAGTLATARSGHSATLLASGKVLITAGHDNGGALAGTELYDPASNSWSAGPSLVAARVYHSATLLPSGKVYVAGGAGSSGALLSAELYDPAANSFSAAANLATNRADHTATLLASGRVLLVGGDAGSSASLVANPEVYDPASNTVTIQSAMLAPRYGHTATRLASGDVLVTGGFGQAGKLASTELFDPSNATYTVTATASANGTITPPTQTVNGGDTVTFTTTVGYASSMVGVTGNGCTVNQVGAMTYTSTIHANCAVTAQFLGPMSSNRFLFTATMLASGKVLVAGGSTSTLADLYDPATKTWSAGGTMQAVRYAHTATRLPSGKVLVTGGAPFSFGPALATTEIYDPATNTWSAGSNMSLARAQHAAALLSTGKVLVAGSASGGPTGHAELYDPGSNSWSAAAAPHFDRSSPAAVVLQTGKVLMIGGSSLTTELYDPVTNTWGVGGNLPNDRNSSQTLTLLSTGKVLLAGGSDQNANSLATTAIYTPATNTWSAAASMGTSRLSHSATLLGNGKVLVLGGYTELNFGQTFLDTAELYDPASNTWSMTTNLSIPRYGHTSTLLPGGLILVAGGDPSAVPSVELYGAIVDNIFRNGFEGP